MSPLSVPARPTGALSPGRLPAPPPPRLTGRGTAVVLAGWAVFAVATALVLTAAGQVPLASALRGQALLAVLLALASVPWLLVVRGLDGRPLAQAAAYAVLFPICVLGAVSAFVFLLGQTAGAEAEATVRAAFGWIAFEAGIAHAVLFASVQAALASSRARLREQQASGALSLAREAELRALKAQLHPHFLFNALNAVSADVARDPEGAREALASLGDLLRYALDAGTRDLVPLSDEVAFAREYLALEARRMGERLRTRWDVDERALAAAVPPLVLQTLVENAVQHGLAPRRTGGTVAVSVGFDGAHVRVRVWDDGMGVAGGALAPGIGLANADERLRLLLGEDAGLRLHAGVDGFDASFRVPGEAPDSAAPGPAARVRAVRAAHVTVA